MITTKKYNISRQMNNNQFTKNHKEKANNPTEKQAKHMKRSQRRSQRWMVKAQDDCASGNQGNVTNSDDI